MKMKKQLLAVAICGLMMAGGAMAADDTATNVTGTSGVVHFTGKITDASCDITSNTADQTVDLGAWAVNYFDDKDETTQTHFAINVENCPSSVTHVATRFTGTRDSGDASLLKITSGDAKGVGIKLYEKNQSTQVKLDTVTEGVDIKTAENATGKTQLDFYADYKTNGQAIAVGDANADANFTMIYN